MNPGIPFKKQILNRYPLVNRGGNGRYRYDLCPQARTVVVTDLNDDVGTFTALSIASTARVSTISLTAGVNYHNIVFRSLTQEVWVFGNTNTVVIDANPNSVTFNTIVKTISVGLTSENGIVYYNPTNDLFHRGAIIFNPKTDSTTSISSTPIIGNGVTRGYYFNGFFSNDGNGLTQGIVNDLSTDVLHGLIPSSGKPIIVGNMMYAGINPLTRFSLEGIAPRFSASISLSATVGAIADSAYDPVAKRILICSHASTAVLVANLLPTFSNVGNLASNLTSILASNQTGQSTALYSPWSEKVYIRGSRGGSGAIATGVNRYYIIDLRRTATADMVCGWRGIDAGSQVTGILYNNTFATLNCLQYDRYDS